MKATVIGVGAIGRQVGLQLAAIGVPRLQIVDFDAVDLTNVTTQGYLAADVGQPKVLATAAAIRQTRPGHPGRDASRTATGREWRSARPYSAAWTPSMPARPSGDRRAATVPVLVRWPDAGRGAAGVGRGRRHVGRDHYPTTLFAQAEAQPGRCTARSTIYAASIAAGLMVHQFTRWLRGMPVDRDTSLNLLAGEWNVG